MTSVNTATSLIAAATLEGMVMRDVDLLTPWQQLAIIMEVWGLK
jgi:hypothetical protein